MVMFSTEPFNAGHIECDKDKLIARVAQQFYIWSGSECTAKPNQGFEFVSWQENLGGNSTQLIKFSSPPSIWDSILDFLQNLEALLQTLKHFLLQFQQNMWLHCLLLLLRPLLVHS